MNDPKVEDHIPLMCQLRRAATLPPVEQNGMIAAIVFSMQSRTQFDFASMETVHENILHKVCNSSIFFEQFTNIFTLLILNLRGISGLWDIFILHSYCFGFMSFLVTSYSCKGKTF